MLYFHTILEGFKRFYTFLYTSRMFYSVLGQTCKNARALYAKQHDMGERRHSPARTGVLLPELTTERSEQIESAAEHLREASSFSRLGEEEDTREHIAQALENLRDQASARGEEAEEELTQLTQDLSDIADDLETGARTARTLARLAERAQALAETLTEENDEPERD